MRGLCRSTGRATAADEGAILAGLIARPMGRAGRSSSRRRTSLSRSLTSEARDEKPQGHRSAFTLERPGRAALRVRRRRSDGLHEARGTGAFTMTRSPDMVNQDACHEGNDGLIKHAARRPGGGAGDGAQALSGERLRAALDDHFLPRYSASLTGPVNLAPPVLAICTRPSSGAAPCQCRMPAGSSTGFPGISS